MRLLVTGGAGFIGSHVVRRLLPEAEAALVVDNLSTGFAANVPEGVELREIDVRDRDRLAGAFREFRPTVVCHLAAQVSTRYSYEDPVLDASTNILGTLNVVEECVVNSVEHVVHASSMVVYGNAERQPVKETDPCRPVSLYGISKYAAERSALAICSAAGLPLTVLRLFLTYGPGQSLDNPYQGMLAIFISRVLRGEPIVIYGDGEQSRDMLHVRDVAEAFAAALASGTKGVYNAGTGRSHTINTVVDYVLAAFGHTRGSYPVHCKPPSSGDQRHIEADARSFGSASGWTPQVVLREGVPETVEWARHRWAS